MASSNQSPSYLEERERARKFLLKHPDGQEALQVLKQHATNEEMTRIFDDDSFTNWGDMVEEFKDSTVISQNCREARAAFELAAQANTQKLPPPKGKGRFRHLAQIPEWYMLRRPIEMADPEYWNSPVNMYRELLAHPQWSCVPEWYLRNALESHLPKGKKVVLAND